jgi:hypothetical protein
VVEWRYVELGRACARGADGLVQFGHALLGVHWIEVERPFWLCLFGACDLDCDAEELPIMIRIESNVGP